MIALLNLLGFLCVGIIIGGGEVETEYGPDNWKGTIYSSSKTPGAAFGGYNSPSQAVLENASLPDVGPVVGIYDPEIQALLAFE